MTPSSQEKKGRAKHSAEPREAGSILLSHFPDGETVASSAQAPQPVLTGCGSHPGYTASVSTQVPVGYGPSIPTWGSQPVADLPGKEAQIAQRKPLYDDAKCIICQATKQ